MNSKINNFAFVITLILCLAAAIAVVAQSAAVDPATPQLRPGISVKLPVTQNSVAVPDADKLDAVVLAITRDGSVYLGLDQTELSSLPTKVNESLSKRAEKVLYIKADARTSYESLVKVLDAVRKSNVKDVTLLTQQNGTPSTGIIPPKGLELQVISR